MNVKTMQRLLFEKLQYEYYFLFLRSKNQKKMFIAWQNFDKSKFVQKHLERMFCFGVSQTLIITFQIPGLANIKPGSFKLSSAEMSVIMHAISSLNFHVSKKKFDPIFNVVNLCPID